MEPLARVENAGALPRVHRVEQLLARMTLAEKIGQMTQSPLFAHHAEPEAFELLLGEVKAGRVGSFLNPANREQRNRLQRAAIEDSRLGIPLMFGRDVIHGYRTIFPIPLALGASFNPELAEAVASAAAA